MDLGPPCQNSAKSQSTAVSTEPAKPLRPRGRSRKIKAATEQSAAPPIIPKPIDGKLALASTHIQSDAVQGKIDKSLLTIRRGASAPG